MKDEEIVELYWQRSEDALRETERKYGAYLSKIARGILFDREDSRECVNDTYLAAWNSMPEHRPGVLSTYLGKITRQLCIDRFRRKHSEKRRPSQYALSLSELEDCIPGEGGDPGQLADVRQLDAVINAFVHALPEMQRNVFIGRYYFFDPIKSIAGYCGISESNAKTMLHRTRQKLREHLLKEDYVI